MKISSVISPRASSASVAAHNALGARRIWFVRAAGSLLLVAAVAMMMSRALEAAPVAKASATIDEERQLQLMLMFHQTGSVTMMPRLPQATPSDAARHPRG